MALLLLGLTLAACSDVRSMRRSRDVDGLVALLSHDDSHTRVKAVDALGHVGDSRAVAPLIRMLRDADPHGGGAATVQSPRLQVQLDLRCYEFEAEADDRE